MRTGKRQKGRFDVQPGMAFIMQNMDTLVPGRPEIQPGKHPWLVTSVGDDYVEIIMCSTLKSESEDKYRIYSLDYDDTTDIPDSCPPMDHNRESRASLDTFMILPKKELFTHELALLNDNTDARNFETEGIQSLCLSEMSLACINKEINNYLADHSRHNEDPFKCLLNADYMYELEHGGEVPREFTKESYEQQFGWEHLPEADTRSMYPYEDKMHAYEKTDRLMVQTVRERNMGKYCRTKTNNELFIQGVASVATGKTSSNNVFKK